MSRARVWTFITYPESMPELWQDQIEETAIPWLVSPLHNLDLVDIKDVSKGYKKEHYHHMIMFSQVKSYKQVLDIVAFLNGTKKIDQVHSVGAMVRYFCHADQKKKAQYDPDEILEFNGADKAKLWVQNDTEIFNKMDYFLDIIKDNQLVEFSTFIDFVRKHHPQDFFLVVQHQYFIANYIKSSRYGGLEHQ